MRSPMRFAWRSLIPGAALWLAVAADGAVDYRAYIEGVTPGWVRASGFEQGVARKSGALPILAELILTKPSESSSPLLAQKICAGQLFPSVRLAVREAALEGVRFYSIRMSDVLVSSIEFGGDFETNFPTERISMNYSKIEWTYIQTDAQGQAGNTTSTFWDVGANAGGPSDPDTDDDGMPDSYEAGNGLKPLVADAGGDKDLDGMNNLEEFQAGTSAGNSNSIFRVSGVSSLHTGGLNVRVTFASVPGRTYDLYALSAIGGVPAFLQTVPATAAATTVDLNLPGIQTFVLVKVRVE